MAIFENFVSILRFIVVSFYLTIDLVVYKFFRRNINTNNNNFNEENIEGKVVVVTGGSLGMGKASAKEFAQRGATVVIGDVDLKNGQISVEEIKKETGNNNVKLFKLDLSDMDSVEEFAKKVSMEYPKIKILLNNAGVAPSLKNLKTKDGFHSVVAINYMGHFLLTNLLLENLKAEQSLSRVVSMSSTMMLCAKLDLDDLNMDLSGYGYENALPYNNTKLCNALFSKELGTRVANNGIRTYALCPGLVNSTIFRNTSPKLQKAFKHFCTIWSLSPNEAASEFIMYCALDKSIEKETGKMYRYREHFSAADRRLDDDALAGRLWSKSSELVKLQERLARFK